MSNESQEPQVENTEVSVEPSVDDIDAMLERQNVSFTETEYSDSEKSLMEEVKDDLQAVEQKDDSEKSEDTSLENETDVAPHIEEVPTGPTVEFKADGEVRNLSLEDIQKTYPEVLDRLKEDLSGQVSWSKKFKELDTERKSFYNERQDFLSEKRSIEEYIEQSRAKLENGNIEDSVKVLAELGGLPFHQYRAQILQWALPQLVAQQEMTPEQLRIQELEAERAYEREQEESRSRRAEAEQSQKELVNRINEAREAHKITDEEWDKALVQASSQKDLNELGVDDVVSLALSTRIDTRVSEVVSEIEEFPKESVDTLKGIVAQNPDFDKETIKQIITQALEVAKSQEESKSVEKEVAEKIGKKLSPKKPKVSKKQKEQSSIDAMISKHLN